MLKVVDLPVPKPDRDLIESLKDCVDQAERAEFESCVVVKLKGNGQFQVHVYGDVSVLRTVGAMHDVMNAAIPECD